MGGQLLARKPRIHYNGALYHVIARGNNKDSIFKQDENKNQYLERLFKYVEQYGGSLYAYVIMDNHCHMIRGIVRHMRCLDIFQKTRRKPWRITWTLFQKQMI